MAAANAQQPSVPSLAEFADGIAEAHRPAGPVAKIDSFDCDLELHLIDKRAEAAGQADLSVQFLLWKREGSRKVRPLIRYRIREAAEPIVRGRDQNGWWQLFGGEPRDLRGADFVQDLAACRKHTNLARQLVRFLSPDDVVRSLKNPGVVQIEALKLGRRRITCHTLIGRLDAFPLQQQAGDDAPVQLKIYAERNSGKVIAADVWPVVDGKPDTRRDERILLMAHDARDGVLVPFELAYLFRDEEGHLVANSRVKITRLELRPKLKAGDFDRTR